MRALTMSMADITEPLLQNCGTCGTPIDVSDAEPCTEIHCPTCGETMRARRQFGSFELQDLLGAGGMGSVYRALDVNLNRQVALKLLRQEYSSNPEFTKQFAHEASITALINHPNVVKVYSSGADHGLLYIAMELVDKGSLDDLMTRHGRVDERQALEVGIHIAQGLNAAFERGLIHRDVKPGNILFADSQIAKIVDFGLAVPVDQAGTIGGEIWGTPYYVAPEKLDNRPEDFRSDMYSLGATLFHAIAGRPPHDSDDPSISALREIKSRPVSLRSYAPGVSKATAYVIDRSLQHDPDKRFESYSDFVHHLEHAKEELRSVGKSKRGPTTRRIPVKQEPPKNSKGWLVAGMLTAIALGGAGVFTFQQEIFRPPSVNVVPDDQQAAKAAEYKKSYDAAREQLITGKFAEAAAAFRTLESQPEATEPLRSWSGFHAALSGSLAGKLEDANQDWQKLIDRGAFSQAPEDQKLANFFLETARRANTPEPNRKQTLNEYPSDSYEALAILAVAAKNWSLGAFQDSEAFFRAFLAAAPSGNAWVRDYEPLANSHLNDLQVQDSIVALAKSATTPEQKKAALPSLQSAIASLKLKGKLQRNAERRLQTWEQEIATFEQQEAQKRAEQEASDSQVLADTKAKSTPLTLQYKFSEARVALAGATVVSERGRREKEALMKRAELLSLFKIQLIKDLAISGYAAPITKRGGTQLPAVSRATDSHIEIKTPYGSLPVPWTEITYDSVLAMAQAFLRPDLPPEQLADRKWLLGVYALFTGKDAEGRALLTEVAQAKPEYQEILPMLLE